MTLIQTLTQVEVNPLNLKCRTLPILSLTNPYSRAFHLSWFGFFVAFLSWFAFSPLIPEAIKKDLNLTTAQIGNSNIVSLCATLIVRIVAGPLVDRYGPRKVMAALLLIGAIPSGLAGTIKSASRLYVVRFFIGILGATFVPCQAWTTAFFDKNIVGRANALVGGWGNAGGGITFILMVALFNALVNVHHLTSHVAWRAAFGILPVPVLVGTAILVYVAGSDHPAGKWEDRYKMPVAADKHADEDGGQKEEESPSKDKSDPEKGSKRSSIVVDVDPITPPTTSTTELPEPTSSLDTAVNSPLTLSKAAEVLTSSLTWLPALAYATTFGYELAIDANLANVLFGLYPTLGQTKAGYITATYGLLNIFTRPFGGYLGDIVYKRMGVPGKKYFTLVAGFLQGLMSLGVGLYIDRKEGHPSLAVVIVLLVITAVFNEAANGLNFSLVPHCSPNSNGSMSGLVGAMGNTGGVFFALIFRLHPLPHGKAFWISGIVTMAINVMISWIPVPSR